MHLRRKEKPVELEVKQGVPVVRKEPAPKQHKIILDELETECFEKYTKVTTYGVRDKTKPFHRITLVVGVQSFQLEYQPDNAAEAKWMRQMMAKALANIICADHLSAIRSRSQEQKEPDLSALATLLIDKRKKLNITQKVLAERLGMKMQQIQRYEKSNYKSASLTTMVKIAVALGLRKES